LGGSSTECTYVPEKNRFPFLVGRVLEGSTALKVNSINGGVSGNNTLHSLDILLNLAIPLHPQIVVLMHNINDLTMLLYTGSYYDDHPTKSPLIWVQKITEHPLEKRKPTLGSLAADAIHWYLPHTFSSMVALVNPSGGNVDEWHQYRGKKAIYDRQKISASFRSKLESFVFLCRSHGIVPVLMTQASRYLVSPDAVVRNGLQAMKDGFGIDYPEFQTLYVAFNDLIRQVAGETGTVLIDLDRLIPRNGSYIYDGVHFNEAGSIAAANIIAAAIRGDVLKRNAIGQE
jgi:lysophospholipase L1-like esterase